MNNEDNINAKLTALKTLAALSPLKTIFWYTQKWEHKAEEKAVGSPILWPVDTVYKFELFLQKQLNDN